MTTIYKFKRGTEQYQILADYDANTDKWGATETTIKLEEFLGCEIGEYPKSSINCNPYQLTMRNPPTHLVENFKKPIYDDKCRKIYECKKASKLNKDWVKFCEELGLRDMRKIGWALELGWLVGKGCSLYRIDNDYYVEPRGGTFDTDEFLEPIDGATFFRIRADFEDRNKSK